MVLMEIGWTLQSVAEASGLGGVEVSWWKKRVDYSGHRTITWVVDPILVRTKVSRLDEALFQSTGFRGHRTDDWHRRQRG